MTPKNLQQVGGVAVGPGPGGAEGSMGRARDRKGDTRREERCLEWPQASLCQQPLEHKPGPPHR